MTYSNAKLQSGISAGNEARRRGRKLKFLNLQVLAADQYIQLAKGGGSVSAQRLFDSLKAKYPEENWNKNTMRDWHKIFVAGCLEGGIGEGESVEVEL
mgnify:CR=1 FL=1